MEKKSVYISDGWKCFHFSVCQCAGFVLPTKLMASSLLSGDITVKMRTVYSITLTIKYWTSNSTDVSPFSVHTGNIMWPLQLLPLCSNAFLFCVSYVSFLPHLLFVHLTLRDVLPFTLKLPEAIASAKTQKELEEVAQLGAGSLVYYFIGLKFCINTLLKQPH